jgi:hypothetical protein
MQQPSILSISNASNKSRTRRRFQLIHALEDSFQLPYYSRLIGWSGSASPAGFGQLMVGCLQLLPSLLRDFHGSNQLLKLWDEERKHDGGRHRSALRAAE